MTVSRYELQWMAVLNCIVIALFGVVAAIDPDESIVWGFAVVIVMAAQIYSATRPDRRSSHDPKEVDGPPHETRVACRCDDQS